ncbi:S-layer family protein [Limnohabitans sp. WS1]|uniref:beta strand repeat-containing protein n=1 Tax=Limnohabitans sp. WS1 TaxID=1100726 RepID=UPI000D39B143|nr:hypothetical protein [Limnohabitans sp. WS1]PUE15557.1 hypothetical protein B9Z48_11915 [Limnohabitans sp. WS1]
MAATSKANVKAIVQLASGGQQTYTLDALSKVKLSPGAKIALVDQTTGKPVQGLLAKRKGKDLVLELEGQGEVATLGEFYSVPNVAFFPVGEIPASASTAGAITAETASTAMTRGGESVVYASTAGMGSTALMVLGGVGLAAAAGGGGGGSTAVPLAPVPTEVFRLVQKDGDVLKVFDAVADPLHQDKLRLVTSSGLGNAASSPLAIPVNENYVMNLSLLKTLAVTGKGNLWVLVDADKQTVILNIQLQGGTLTFDMPTDASQVTVDSTSTVNLGGGKLVVSDGQVFVNATTFATWNVGEVILNSTLILDFTTTNLTDAQIRTLVSSVDASGQGQLQILVASEAQAQIVLDAMAQNTLLKTGPAPQITVEGPTFDPITVDLSNIVDAKVKVAVDSLLSEIADLNTALSAAIASGDATNAAATAKVAADLVTAVSNLTSAYEAGDAALQAKIDTLTASLGTEVTKLTTYIDGEIADLNTALSAAIASGDATNAAATAKVAADLVTAVSNLTSAYEAGDAALQAKIDTLTASLGTEVTKLTTYIDGEIADLNTALSDAIASGDATNAAATAKVAADLVTAVSNLTTAYQAGDTALQGKIDTLTASLATEVTKLTTYIDGEIADLNTALSAAIASGDATNAAAIAKVAADLVTAVSNLTSAYEAGDAALQAKIDTLTASLGTEVTKLTTYIDGEIADLNTALSAAIASGDATNAAAIAKLTDNTVYELDGVTVMTPATTASIAGLKAALDTLNSSNNSAISGLETKIGVPADPSATPPVQATGLYKTIADAVAAAVLSLQGQIDTQVGLLEAAIASGDKTNADAIAQLINDAPVGGQPTTASIAGLKAALDALNSSTSGALSGLETKIGVPADPSATPPVQATGLYKTIADAVAAAVLSLQGQIDTQVGLLEAAIASGDKTNADAIAQLINDAPVGGQPTTASIAGLKAALDALNSSTSGALSGLETKIGVPADPSATPPVQATGLYKTIADAVAAAVLSLQGQIDTQVGLLEAAIASGDKTNADAIAQLINDAPVGGQPTTASIAGLKAALDALNSSTSGALSGLETKIGVPADPSATPPVQATGLFKTIADAVAAAVLELSQDITALQTQVDSNTANTALIQDDTNAVGNSSGSPTTNSIAGLKIALAALQSAASSAGGELSALAARVLALEGSLDTTAPAISNIAITASNPDANGAYGEGDVVRVTVSFDDAVLVNGAPTFALDVGGTTVQAALVGGAGSNKLVFEYTLTGAQTDTDVIGYAANALKLNSGAITDAAGNSVADNFGVITSDLIADSDKLKVDNTPLTVTLTAGAVFGSQFNAGNVLVGFVDNMSNEVFLKDFDANGQYQVPIGANNGFVDIDTFIKVIALNQDPRLLQNGLTPPGGTVQFDFSDKVAFFFAPGFAVILTEANLRSILNFERDPSYTPEQINALIAENSVPAESVWLYDGANAGETLSAEFLAAVQGRNPADVVLDITSSLTVAQAAKLIEAGFNLVDNATYTVRDWDTTLQAGMLNADTRAALQGATQVVARGDELANAMRFTSFDQSVNLRVEAGAGNDSIDAGRGNDTIVGQAGGDTINLTSADTSRDTVVYQTVNDGASLPVSTVTFSTDTQDYRVGSVFTVTINGVEYTHTVATEYGDTITDQTIQSELAAFASEIAARTVPVDNSAAVVAYRVSIVDILTNNGLNLEPLTVADLDANGRYLVPAGYRVIPADTLLLLGTSLGNIIGSSGQYLLGIIGVGAGGDYHADSSLQLFDISLLPNYTANPSMGGPLFMATPASIEAAFGTTLAGATPPMTVADLHIFSGDVLSAVTSNGSSLSFFGKSGATLTAFAGGDVEAAIDNNGQATVVTVDFSGTVADWPTETNTGHTTKFVRELSITIDGTEITANVVFDPVSGAPDPAKSVLALKTAIETANGTGGSIAGKLASVTISNTDPTMLTLTGKVAPVTDAAAPTFKVDSATVDTNGVQQVSKVTYSSNNADYYEGGTLSVEIAGQTVTADMVAGDAAASVQNLRDAIDVAAKGLKTGVFDFSASGFDLTADALLNNANGVKQRYVIDMKIGDVSVLKSVNFQGDIAGNSETKEAGVTVASDTTKATTVAEVVDELNRAFDGVAVFVLDAAGDKITFSTGSANSVTSSTGSGDASLTLRNQDGTAGADGKSASSVTTVSQSNADIAAVLESVEQSFEIAQVLGGYSVKNLVESGSPEYVEYAGFAPEGGFYLAAEKENLLYDPEYRETFLAFGNVANITHPFNYRIDETLDRVSGTYFGIDGTTVINADFVYFENVQAFVDSLKKGGDTTGELLKDVYDVSYIDGTLKFTQKVSGPGFADVGTAVRLNFGERIGSPTLVIKSATEESDPLHVDASMGYQGEQQQATLTLETVGQDGAYDVLSDGTATSRGADVYFAGGKAYVSITGFGTDGVKGGGDDVTTIVSVDMVKSGPAVATLAYKKPLLVTDTIGYGGHNLVFSNPDDPTLPTSTVSLGGSTMAEYLAGLETSTYVQSAELVDGKIVITFKPDISRVSYSEFNQINRVNGEMWFTSGNVYANTDSAYLTSEALVDAINDLVQSKTFEFGTALTAGTTLTNDGGYPKVRMHVGVQDADGSLFVPTQADVSFTGIQQINVTNVGEALAYLNTVYAGHATWTLTENGSLLVVPDVLGASLVPAFGDTTFSNVIFTLDKNGNPDSVFGTPVDGPLNGVIASAALKNGTITLTAADYSKESFEISDVTLDYQGVKQQATITLDGAGTYTNTFSDGATTGGTTTRGVDIYYAGGKVYATISSADGTLSSTVSVDMVKSAPAVATLAYKNPLLVTDTIGYGGHNLVFSNPDDPTFPTSTVSLGGSTMAEYLAGLETSTYVQSAELVDGKIVITFKPDISSVAYSESNQINRVNGELWFTSGKVIANTDSSALTSKALADSINYAINGSTGTPVTLSFAKDIGVFTLEEEMLLGNHYGSPSIQMTYIINGGTPNEVFFDGDTSDNVGLIVRGTTTQLTTIADLLSYIETLSGIGSATIKDGVIQITSEATGANATLGITFLDVEDRYWVNYTGISWRPGLLDPQTVNGTGGPMVNIDPVLSQLLQGAEVVNGSIVLTAKNPGEHTFDVTDVALDYQGQHQIATATYSTTGTDYYSGGSLSMTIDTTPDVAGDSANDVTVTVDMVNGDAAASQQALVDAILVKAGLVSSVEPAALVTIDRTSDFVNTDTNSSGGTYGSDGSGFSSGFYLKYWFVKIEDSTGDNDFFKSGSAYFHGSLSNRVFTDRDGQFTSLQGFLDHLEALTFDAQVNPTTSRTDKVFKSVDIVNGNIVFTTNDEGENIKLTVGLESYGNYFAPENTPQGWDETLPEYFSGAEVFEFAAVGEDGQGKYSDTGGGSSGSSLAVDPLLAAVLGGVTLDSATGTMTLTSKDKTEHAFDISTATITDPAKVKFSEAKDSYIATGNDKLATTGTVSVTVLGKTYTANIVAGDAAGTAQALLTVLQASPSATPPGLDTTEVTVSLTGTTFTFTAASGTTAPLAIAATQTLNGVKQVTDIDMSSVKTDNDFIAGIGREISIDIGGQTFTVDGNTRLEILQDLRTKLLAAIALDTNSTGIAAKLDAAGVGVIDEAKLTMTLTARYGELDTLKVSDFTRASIDLSGNNAYQQLDLGFTNSYLNGRTVGDVVKVELGKTSASYTVQASDTGADILNGLAAALQSQFLVSSATADTTARTISLTASVYGANVLGTVSEDEQTNTVRLFTGAVEVGPGFLADEITAGVVTYDAANPESVAKTTSTTAGADLVANKAVETAADLSTVAKDVTDVDQTIVNPGDKGGEDFYGDSPLVGVNQGDSSLVGVNQDFLNPDNGQGADTDGDASLHGDNPLTGAVTGGVFNGTGVDQTFNNPGNSYTSNVGSPQINAGNNSAGADGLYGSNPGTFTDTGLNTTYLNGGTETAPGSGTYAYGTGSNPADNLNLGNGTVSGDGGTSGASAGSVNNSASPSDGLTVTPTINGFAPFEWDFSLLTVRSTGSSVSDVVNNFQTAYDLVALESALLASTVEGDVTGSLGFSTPVLVTKENVVASEVSVTGPYDLPTEIGYAWTLPSADLAFTISAENLSGPTNFGLAVRTIDFLTVVNYNLPSGKQSFDNLADFVADLNATGGAGAPAFTARLAEGGDVILSAPAGYYFEPFGNFKTTVGFNEIKGLAFDLSTTEFGLVTSANSTLDASTVDDAQAVSDLLGSVFDFDAAFGGTTDNSEINTTVFGVTAADNPNVTAIWAHTQSSTGDNTVDAYELNLLATVNTLGQEFQLANFLPKPEPVLLA